MDENKDYLPSIVALLAIIVGPYVSLRIAKKQMETSSILNKQQIISPMRQAWIDSIRQKTSEYLNSCDRLYSFLHSNDKVREFYETNEWDFVPPDADIKIDLLYSEIELMLNDKENDHKDFLTCLLDCRSNVFNKGLTQVDFYNNRAKAIQLCKFILKREWDRVKTDE